MIDLAGTIIQAEFESDNILNGGGPRFHRQIPDEVINRSAIQAEIDRNRIATQAFQDRITSDQQRNSFENNTRSPNVAGLGAGAAAGAAAGIGSAFWNGIFGTVHHAQDNASKERISEANRDFEQQKLDISQRQAQLEREFRSSLTERQLEQGSRIFQAHQQLTKELTGLSTDEARYKFDETAKRQDNQFKIQTAEREKAFKLQQENLQLQNNERIDRKDQSLRNFNLAETQVKNNLKTEQDKLGLEKQKLETNSELQKLQIENTSKNNQAELALKEKQFDQNTKTNQAELALREKQFDQNTNLSFKQFEELQFRNRAEIDLDKNRLSQQNSQFNITAEQQNQQLKLNRDIFEAQKASSNLYGIPFGGGATRAPLITTYRSGGFATYRQ